MAYNSSIEYEQPNTTDDTSSSIRSGLSTRNNEEHKNAIVERHTDSVTVEEIEIEEIEKPEGCVEHIAA